MGGFQWQVLIAFLSLSALVQAHLKFSRDNYDSLRSAEDEELNEDFDEADSCQCGVFMSQQVGLKQGRRGRPRGPPQGEPVVTYDTEEPSDCGLGGFRSCVTKCLDVILKYLPKAGPVICSAAERDVHREKAFLFIKNCGEDWSPTTFSAGKEFCCTDGQHHKC
ncbi:hypothetical protein ACJJTC_007826 [Scirpophaga incertulas]